MPDYFLVNYSYGEEYKNIQDKVIELASQSKFSGAVPSTRDDFVHSNFYTENKEFFDLESRGGHAWFSWKPFVIRSAMEQLPENSVVLYMDVGDIWKDELFDYMNNHFQNNEILVSDSPHEPNKKWTTKDCFIEMDCDEEQYWNVNQVEAGVCAFKVNDLNKSFVETWLYHCMNNNGAAVRDDIDPPKHGQSNHPEFQDHRHDQSILTNLLTRYGVQPVPGAYFKTQCVRCNINI